MIEYLYQNLKKEKNTQILPLYMQLNNISPNQGWRGQERKSLDNREKPKLIICLALIHHLVFSSYIPLYEFIEWVASFGSDAVIEFISRDDEMVQKLLINKADNFIEYSLFSFEFYFKKYFNVQKTHILKEGKRILYYGKSLGKNNI